MAKELLVIYGEELRDELLKVRKLIKKIPLGQLVSATASYAAYRDRFESRMLKNPELQYQNYQCVRQLLNGTIDKLVEELNDRERKYLRLGEN